MGKRNLFFAGSPEGRLIRLETDKILKNPKINRLAWRGNHWGEGTYHPSGLKWGVDSRGYAGEALCRQGKHKARNLA